MTATVHFSRENIDEQLPLQADPALDVFHRNFTDLSEVKEHHSKTHNRITYALE